MRSSSVGDLHTIMRVPARAVRGRQLQRRLDCSRQVFRHVLRILQPVDQAEGRPAAVKIHQRRRLVRKHREAVTHHRVVVVGPLHQRAAALAAPSRFHRPFATVARQLGHIDAAIGRPALAAHPAPRQAPHQLALGHLEHHDDERAAIDQHVVERPRLGDRARKPVEHEAGLRIGLLQAIAHDRDNRLVIDQPARADDVLHRAAQCRSLGHRFAQHVAGRNLRDPVLPADEPGLGSLPRARRADHHEIQGHRRFAKRPHTSVQV